MVVSSLRLNEDLVECVVQSTIQGLSMTDIEPKAVGISRFTTVSRRLSVLLGLHGERNGNMNLNLSENTATFLAGRFMAAEYKEIDDDVIDAVCELGNIIAGMIKTGLQNTPYAFDTISLPALIFGSSYNLYHVKNITTVAVTFEIEEIPVVRMHDRFFTTTVAILEH